MGTPGYKTRILLGDFSLSAKLASIELPFSVDVHDATVFADDGVKRRMPGLSGSSASMSGFIDVGAATDAAEWTTATPLTYAPLGLSRGSAVQLVDAVKANFRTGSTVAGMSVFDLGAETDGFTDFGVSLRDLTAATADGDETAHDNSASTANGGVGHLHVTAYSGLTSATVKIQDSSDNNTFADLIEFSSVTGVTGERLTVSGSVDRYVRASIDVTGTGSITFAVAFARR